MRPAVAPVSGSKTADTTRYLASLLTSQTASPASRPTDESLSASHADKCAASFAKELRPCLKRNVALHSFGMASRAEGRLFLLFCGVRARAAHIDQPLQDVEPVRGALACSQAAQKEPQDFQGKIERAVRFERSDTFIIEKRDAKGLSRPGEQLTIGVLQDRAVPRFEHPTNRKIQPFKLLHEILHGLVRVRLDFPFRQLEFCRIGGQDLTDGGVAPEMDGQRDRIDVQNDRQEEPDAQSPCLRVAFERAAQAVHGIVEPFLDVFPGQANFAFRLDRIFLYVG